MRAPEPLTGVRLRLAGAVGAVESARPLGGTAWMVEVGGRRLVAKAGPGARDEADGLRQLGAVAGGPPVPDVVLVEPDLLVTDGDRPDAADGRARRGARARPGAPAPGPAPALGWRLVVGRHLPRRPVAGGGRRRLLRGPAPRPLGPLRARGGRRPGRRPARPSSSRRAAPRSSTATCGGATSSSGPMAAPGSSTRPSTVATPRRTWPCSPSSVRCPTACSGRIARCCPSVTAGKIGCSCSSSPRCSSTLCCSMAGTAPRWRQGAPLRLTPRPRGRSRRHVPQPLASTSARYRSLTCSGRKAARKEFRASWEISSGPRSNAAATALRLSATYPPK